MVTMKLSILKRLHLVLAGLNQQLGRGQLFAAISDPKTLKRIAFLLQETDRLLTGQVSNRAVYMGAAEVILSGSTVKLSLSDSGYTSIRVTIMEAPYLRMVSGGPRAYELWEEAGLV